MKHPATRPSVLRWESPRGNNSTEKLNRDRQMLMLHEREGLTYEQLGGRFGLTKWGVASAIKRERKRVRP